MTTARVVETLDENSTTVPFTCLGPAGLEQHESERPIKVVWRLRHPMPAEMFEVKLDNSAH